MTKWTIFIFLFLLQLDLIKALGAQYSVHERFELHCCATNISCECTFLKVIDDNMDNFYFSISTPVAFNNALGQYSAHERFELHFCASNLSCECTFIKVIDDKIEETIFYFSLSSCSCRRFKTDKAEINPRGQHYIPFTIVINTNLQ
jgi:hypothetical protein